MAKPQTSDEELERLAAASLPTTPTSTSPDAVDTALAASQAPAFVDPFTQGQYNQAPAVYEGPDVNRSTGEFTGVPVNDNGLPDNVTLGNSKLPIVPVQGPSQTPVPVSPAQTPTPPANAAPSPAPASTGVIAGPTALTPADEQKYQAWKASLPPRLQEDKDYDLRGYFKETGGAPLAGDNSTVHLPDKYKLPGHETFSSDSIYYNDQTKNLGGIWSQDKASGNWTFTPNDPNKAIIREDAQGNRIAGEAPHKLGDLVDSDKRLQEAFSAKQKAQQGAIAAEEAGKKQIADTQAQQAKEAQALLDRQQKVFAQSQTRIQAQVDRAKTEKFTDFWADKTVGQKILYALSILAGGVSWEAHHENPAAKALHDQIQLHFEQQKERHAEIWRQIDRDVASGRALHEDQLQELANFKANQASQLQAVITKAEYLATKAKNPVAQANLKEEAAKLSYERDKVALEASRADAAAEETRNYHKDEIRVKQDANNAVRDAARINAGAAVAGGATPEERYITDLVQHDYKDPLIGTSSSPGLIYGRDQTASIVKEARDALKSGDPERMAIAATHIKEQSSRLLTHTGLTNMTLQQQNHLAGYWDQLATEVNSVVKNKPTVGAKTFKNLIGSIEGIVTQQNQQIDDAHNRFKRQMYGDSAQSIPGEARTQSQIDKAKAEEYALFGSGTGTPGTPAVDPRDKTRQRNEDTAKPEKYSPSKDRKAFLSHEALKPGSGATDDQKENARKYLRSKGLMK